MKKVILAGLIGLGMMSSAQAKVDQITQNDAVFSGNMTYTVTSEACNILHCGKFTGKTLIMKLSPVDSHRFIIAFGSDIDDTIGFRGRTPDSGAEQGNDIAMPVKESFFQEINEDSTPIPVRSDSKCIMTGYKKTYSHIHCDVYPAQSHVVMDWDNPDKDS